MWRFEIEVSHVQLKYLLGEYGKGVKEIEASLFEKMIKLNVKKTLTKTTAALW